MAALFPILALFVVVVAGMCGALIASPSPLNPRDTLCDYGLDEIEPSTRTMSLTMRNDDDLCLFLEMLAALLDCGSAVPRALQVLGRQTGMTPFEDVALLLMRGVEWDMAWKGMYALDFSSSHFGSERSSSRSVSSSSHSVGSSSPYLCAHFLMIADLLKPAWEDGTSAAPRLHQATRRLRTEAENYLSKSGSVLSVRILLPVGLCFLPALVVLGVVPLIASFALMK